MAARNDILNQNRMPQKSGWLRTTALAAGFSIAGGAGVYYVLSQPDTGGGALLETSQSASIQQPDTNGVLVPDLEQSESEVTQAAVDAEQGLRPMQPGEDIDPEIPEQLRNWLS